MDERAGIEGLAADLQRQRPLLAARVPAYERLLRELEALLDKDAALASRLAAALQGRTFFAAYDRPLLLLAALRLDALLEGATHPLHASIAAPAPDPDAVTPAAVAAAVAADRARFFETVAFRYVQTNETSRAVAWRWPAALAGCNDGRRPLALVDIGASAGLNLVADALPAPWVDEHGAPIPVAKNADIVLRLGLDARPLDATDSEDIAWLRACIWPGDDARLARLDAALAAWRATPALVERADISAVPGRLAAALATLPPDTLVLAYQTVVRDYLPPDVARAYRDAMLQLLGSTERRRLAWLELESVAKADTERPAALTAHLRGPDGVVELQLSRSHWHPSTLVVDRAAASRFADLA